MTIYPNHKETTVKSVLSLWSRISFHAFTRCLHRPQKFQSQLSQAMNLTKIKNEGAGVTGSLTFDVCQNATDLAYQQYSVLMLGTSQTHTRKSNKYYG